MNRQNTIARVIKKLSKEKITLFRSDDSPNFSIHMVKMPLQKYKLKQFMHKPEQLMTYLKGIFATPDREYAEKYPQENLYTFEIDGNFLHLPKDADKIEGETLMDAANWIRKNYDGAIGIKASDTNFGKFDEVVIFDKNKIKNIKKISE